MSTVACSGIAPAVRSASESAQALASSNPPSFVQGVRTCFTEAVIPLAGAPISFETSTRTSFPLFHAASASAGTASSPIIRISNFALFGARTFGQIDRIIVGMIVIGCLYIVVDRLIIQPIENLTIARWGLLQR